MTTTALEARSLRFAYPRCAPVIDDLDVTIRHGETVALSGPSGRGKSTLLYLLGLLVTPLGGEVLIGGRPTSGMRDAERTMLRARHMGFVFQDAALDQTRTVLDNVIESSVYRGEPRREMIDRALGLLERFGVELRASARPGQASGGQAARIALARAMLAEPTIVLADEPTGNLDDQAAAVVMAALREASARGAGVVVATHDASVRRMCDHVVEL